MIVFLSVAFADVEARAQRADEIVVVIRLSSVLRSGSCSEDVTACAATREGAQHDCGVSR